MNFSESAWLPKGVKDEDGMNDSSDRGIWLDEK